MVRNVPVQSLTSLEIIQMTVRREVSIKKDRTPVNYATPLRNSMNKAGSSKKEKLTSDVAQTPSQPQETARSLIKLVISKTTKVNRDAFLTEYREYFLPLLPVVNHISKLPEGKGSVQFTQLSHQPSKVVANMKPYQLSGLSFLVHMHNNGMPSILGDEMGLGKTLQTLSLFQYLEQYRPQSGGEHRPYLVICPLSVLSSWVSEARKWTPDLEILRFHGPNALRQKLKLQAMGKLDRFGNNIQAVKFTTNGKPLIDLDEEDDVPDIVITTYEMFVSEQQWFKTAFVWRYCVLDEGHKIKNSASDVSQALQSLQAEYRLLLTGTPIQNNLLEMWSLLHWLLPDVFAVNTSEAFKAAFNLERGQVSTDFMNNSRRLLELLMLRRMKSSPGVNLGLPPKEEVLLYVPLTPVQRHWYTQLLTNMGDAAIQEVFSDAKDKEQAILGLGAEAQPHSSDGMEILGPHTAAGKVGGDSKPNDGKWRRLMNLVMQLRKICIHPYLIGGTIPKGYTLDDNMITTSSKFMVLDRLIDELVFKRKEKVLIFSQFTSTLDWCEDLLTLRGFNTSSTVVRYMRLDGGTIMAKRNLAIRLFNRPDSEYRVMLISTRAGGLGLNLPAANNVIFTDFDWNPQVDLQAEARSHRIGQTRPVTVYKICTQGTVEEQMLSRIRKKLYLSTKITDSMEDMYAHGATPLKRKRGPAVQEEEDDSVPQMDTSQLISLIRRGATTLSHPQIDASEMATWTFETIIEKFKDNPTCTEEANTDMDPAKAEQEWLSTRERVQCAVLEGVQYQRTAKKEVEQAQVLDRAARRAGKNTTVEVDGHTVSKESMACKDWEAVPTMAGKDPSLAEPKRQKKAPINHQDHCQVCHSGGELANCKGCPRAFHVHCLAPEFQGKASGRFQFHCPQHQCHDCERKTTDAGGMIYRCRGCEKGFCEDCLDWDSTRLLGETLNEYEALDYEAKPQAWYIDCPGCVGKEKSKRKALTVGADLGGSFSDFLKQEGKRAN